MNPNQLLPFFMIFSAPKEKQSRLAEAMFPALIPVAPAQQATVSAISASFQVDNEIRRVESAKADEIAKSKTTQAKLIPEVISAIQTVMDKPAGPGKKLTDAEITALPTLSAVLHRMPELLTGITSIALAADQQTLSARAQTETTLGNDAVAAIAALNKKYEDAITAAPGKAITPQKLTAAELNQASPTLDGILLKDPVLRGRIVS